MKQIRNFPAVSTIAVTLTISFYTLLSNYVSPLISEIIPGSGFIVGVFTSVGFYLSVFEILLWIHYKFIDDRLNPREAITGEWFYKLEVRGKEEQAKYGLCRIGRHKGELTATGVHFDPQRKKFTSKFGSDIIRINGNTMIIVYHSAGVDEETFLRHGILFLSTDGVPPQRIYGVWTDVLPSRNAGDIVMYRRDKEVDKAMQSIGYPEDASNLQEITPTIVDESLSS
jgi:hypothetical protein